MIVCVLCKFCDNNTYHKLRKHNLFVKEKVLIDHRKQGRAIQSHTPSSQSYDPGGIERTD